MPSIFSANSSKVSIDGAEITGLHSIVFRVVTEREDIRAVGSNERVDVSFGLRVVQGEIAVRSHSKELDKHLLDQTSFQVVASLRKDKGLDQPASRTITFMKCFAESKRLQMDAGGTALTTYAFTATSVTEE